MGKLVTIVIVILLSISLFGQTKIDSTIIFAWEDSGWGKDQKLGYLYPNEFSTILSMYMWDAGWGDADMISSWTVNEHGDETYSKTEMFGMISETTIENTYDNNGKLVESVSVNTSMFGTVDTTRDVYTYENDNLIENLSQVWNSTDWEDKYRILYSYDNNNNQIEFISENWDGSAWSMDMKMTNSYTNNKISQSITETWYPMLDSTKTKTYFFYNDDKIDFTESENYVNKTWAKYDKHIYTWNNDLLAELIIQEWNGSEYINQSKSINYYGTGGTAIDDINETPQTFSLSNYPNPFNPETNISFELPKDQVITLKIYDIMGNLVTTLTDNKWSAGSHIITWNGTNKNHIKVPSGIYIYMLESSDYKEAKRCLLVK